MRLWKPAAGIALIALALALPVGAASASTSVGLDTDTADVTGVGIRLLDVSAQLQDDPRAQTYIIDNVAPGASIVRHLSVSNSSSETQPVRVYAGAASITDGSFVGGTAAAANELTSWTSLDRSEVELAPDASAEIAVTIAVPADAAEGEQYGVVWAQVQSAPADGSSVITVNRVGIRVYLSVGAGNGPAADFTIDSLTAGRNSDGDPQVVAAVTNTGGRALDLTGALSLTDGPSGLAGGPFSITTSTTLAPGTSGTVPVALDPGLPNGPWTAHLTLASGLVSHDATAQLTFPDAGTGAAVPVATDAGPDLVLLFGGLVAGLLVLSAALALWLRHRRRAVAP